jgi:hydroxymethylpyrimidine pyrophosphatase-like HAD family hydrolase
MGNAMPMVKAAADYVAKDIDEGGLADAVRYALMSFSN